MTPAVLTADSPMTDLANAARFAREHGDSIRYVGKYHKWLVWDGKHWRDDDMSEVQRRAKETVLGLYDAAAEIPDDGDRTKMEKYALAAQRSGRIAGMIELAKSEPGIAVMPEQRNPSTRMRHWVREFTVASAPLSDLDEDFSPVH